MFAFVLGLAWAITSCIADPWPEPDSMENESRSAGDDGAGGWADTSVDGPTNDLGDTASSADDGTGKDTEPADSSYSDTDQGADAGTGDELDASMVFCSAPGESGEVTVVALAGAFAPGGEVLVESASGTVSGTVGVDGGLAVRLNAAAGEALIVSIFTANGDLLQGRVTAGVLQDGAVGNGIVGDGAMEDVSDGELVLRGNGGALADGLLVIGGNLSQSTGRATPVSCNSDGCLFGLLLPGAPGNTIDVFLADRVSRAGLTDVQTVIVP